MSKTKLLGIAVGALIAINLLLLAFLFFNKPSRPGEMPGGPGQRLGPEGPMQIIIERLHFDKEQVERYKLLVQQHRTDIRKTDRQIRDTKNNLYATLTNENTAARDSLQNQLGQLQRQIEHIHYSHFEDIKKLCRPDQLPYFNDLTKDLARFFAPAGRTPKD